MNVLKSLALSILLFLLVPEAHGFDPKPGLYKGTLKVTTAFPNTDVKQAVIQRATGRLDSNGRMRIALSNTFDGIEEAGQQIATLKFLSAVNNDCIVRILKGNFLVSGALVTVTGKTFKFSRTQQLSTDDAEGFDVNYSVTMELKLTRVAP